MREGGKEGERKEGRERQEGKQEGNNNIDKALVVSDTWAFLFTLMQI